MTTDSVHQGEQPARDEEKKHVPEKAVEGCDVGVVALTGAVSHFDPNGPEAKRVLRKIDLHLMPLLMVTYSKYEHWTAILCYIGELSSMDSMAS